MSTRPSSGNCRLARQWSGRLTGSLSPRNSWVDTVWEWTDCSARWRSTRRALVHLLRRVRRGPAPGQPQGQRGQRAAPAASSMPRPARQPRHRKARAHSTDTQKPKPRPDARPLRPASRRAAPGSRPAWRRPARARPGPAARPWAAPRPPRAGRPQVDGALQGARPAAVPLLVLLLRLALALAASQVELAVQGHHDGEFLGEHHFGMVVLDQIAALRAS